MVDKSRHEWYSIHMAHNEDPIKHTLERVYRENRRAMSGVDDGIAEDLGYKFGSPYPSYPENIYPLGDKDYGNSSELTNPSVALKRIEEIRKILEKL